MERWPEQGLQATVKIWHLYLKNSRAPFKEVQLGVEQGAGLEVSKKVSSGCSVASRPGAEAARRPVKR